MKKERMYSKIQTAFVFTTLIRFSIVVKVRFKFFPHVPLIYHHSSLYLENKTNLEKVVQKKDTPFLCQQNNSNDSKKEQKEEKHANANHFHTCSAVFETTAPCTSLVIGNTLITTILFALSSGIARTI
eukprot:TRINITY_DN4142_c0_g2_i2.p1 TRINITY_DN4142_c0_g2~~TRINITY_DN4142_c0_g2_i2.p1  ORF type:complete len:128 (+),score=23.95 TRINITY_DN4142_c0_g2_i2:632-1015(+)